MADGAQLILQSRAAAAGGSVYRVRYSRPTESDTAGKAMRVIRQLVDYLGQRGYLRDDQIDKLHHMGLIESPVSGELDPEDMPIDDLELTVRAHNCLRRAGVDTVGQLIAMSEADLLDIRNMNERAVLDIQLKLLWNGLALREDGHPAWRMDDDVIDVWDAHGDDLSPSPRRRGPSSHLPKRSSRFRKPTRDGTGDPRSKG